jgi:tRNA A37 threonylcarbamoyladenosine modification protein TsaB
MSWLFIDTSERMRVRLALLPGHGRVRERVIRGRTSAVCGLASFMSAASVPSLQGIVAVSGPGPFSAVRSGVLAANLLARTHRLPLYGVRALEARDLRALRDTLVAGARRPSSYVAPVYDAEPNIS